MLALREIVDQLDGLLLLIIILILHKQVLTCTVNEARGIVVDVIDVFLTSNFEIIFLIPIIRVLCSFSSTKALENGTDD